MREQISFPLTLEESPIFLTDLKNYMAVFPNEIVRGKKGFVLKSTRFFAKHEFGINENLKAADTAAIEAIKAENTQLKAELESLENNKLSPLLSEITELKNKLSALEGESTGRALELSEENDRLKKAITALQRFAVTPDPESPDFETHKRTWTIIEKRIASGKFNEHTPMDVVAAMAEHISTSLRPEIKKQQLFA